MRYGRAFAGRGRSRRAWLLGPFAVLCACDVGLTLAGQPAAYRAGDPTCADEANPFARPALAFGPMAFVGLAVVWWAAAAGVMLAVPPRTAFVVAAVMATAHAVGGAAWLARSGPWGWAVAVAYLLVAAEGSVWCWRRSHEPARPET